MKHPRNSKISYNLLLGRVEMPFCSELREASNELMLDFDNDNNANKYGLFHIWSNQK